MGRGRLMETQKQAVIELVQAHRGQGRPVAEVLVDVGVARSSYYRWKKGKTEKTPRGPRSYEITIEERQLIDEVKQQSPQYRHRRIQGVLQHPASTPSQGECSDKSQGRSVDPGENTAAAFQHQLSDSHIENPSTPNCSLAEAGLSH